MIRNKNKSIKNHKVYQNHNEKKLLSSKFFFKHLILKKVYIITTVLSVTIKKKQSLKGLLPLCKREATTRSVMSLCCLAPTTVLKQH